MQITLSIKDDKELRNTIKDMIRGQVTRIIRDDIQNYVAEQLTKQLQTALGGIADKAVRASIDRAEGRAAVKKAVASIVGSYVEDRVVEVAIGIGASKIAPAIHEEIQRQLASVKLNVNVTNNLP